MLTLSSVYRTFWFVQECTYCCGLSACRHLCTLFQLQPECARRCSLAPITYVCSIVEKEMLASIFDFLELEIWL
ncbi:hypothetical protein PVAP13_5KG570307 [Panicum virgatum]|uniref:Uncharacterized protein n=1 Tax=Panicum virgatum TaxID=38727 RepID=A0A8T0SSN0_PANVG|nr:hypothetical protein PVAP13_5KG570307 [Panicum virgatum]